jgi:hypothetical protein
MADPTHNPHGRAIPVGLAASYLNALSELNIAETAIDEKLADLVPGDWDRHADPYDGSIEVYAPAMSGFTAAQLDDLGAAILALGFERCWLHLHGQGTETRGCERVNGRCNAERYYSRDLRCDCPTCSRPATPRPTATTEAPDPTPGRVG